MPAAWGSAVLTLILAVERSESHAFEAAFVQPSQIMVTVQSLFQSAVPQGLQCVRVMPRTASASSFTTTPSSSSSTSSFPSSSYLGSKGGSVRAVAALEAAYQHVGPGWGAFLHALMHSVRQRQISALYKLLHPQVRRVNPEAALQAVFLHKSAVNFEVSIADQFVTYNAQTTSDDIFCKESKIYLSPQYGYPMQFFVWLSLLGPQEIARMMVTVVPLQGQLYIAALHSQMWTHQGEDGYRWVKRADQEYAQKNYMNAYMKYKIARALLYGKSYFRLPFRDEIQSFMDKNLPQQQWHQRLGVFMPQYPIRTTAALLTAHGMGLKVVFELKTSKDTKELEQHCQRSLDVLAQQQWFVDVRCLRCDYHMPATLKDPTQKTTLEGKCLKKPSLLKPPAESATPTAIEKPVK